MPSKIELSDCLLEPLREGGDFTLYRGWLHDTQPILVVGLAADQPSPQGLRRLEHEYSLAEQLDPAWAAKPLALTRHEGRTILVLKDPGGEPLDRLFERDHNQPPHLTRFLRIAIGLTKTLGQVHRHGLIHKDIKPDNVLVDDVGNVWLTGFGIASQFPRESLAAVSPEIVAGTLAYMAPEQTGRMNRSIDTRSDLYSLGVLLYQTLTGALPFFAADPLELVHCHIARQPTPPSERASVPEPVSSLIMKLLAKNAEERYQTAAGLEVDLRRCLAEWQSHGCIDPFPLGAHDVPDRLSIPEKLYGREHEINALLAAFDRVVAQGAPELVLVSGYSGVGKSSVVNELHKGLVLPRGLFAAGKFDQYKRDIPYATLAQAFQTLVRQTLVKRDSEVGAWRLALLEAVGPNGQIIVNLIPELEFIIGKQPPVPDLPPQDAKNRFFMVFRRFLAAFARPEHPLALFLDDLQWLDAATLELIERLITDPDVKHLLLIGAYRDNETSSSDPLMRTLAAVRQRGAIVRDIVLKPLNLDDVGQLVADALHCSHFSSLSLAQLVHEKTGGNPFFAIQFLATLADEGLLAVDSNSAWTWDLGHIRAKRYSENVVDLMIAKVKRLSESSQEALRQLACLGNMVEIATLIVVQEKSEEEIDASLSDAVEAGFVFRLAGSYAFAHDRVQEAAYALIQGSERAATHLRIGRMLVLGTPPTKLGDKIFDIVNQFDRALELLTSPRERDEVAEFNLSAGQRAKAATAYASALTYFAAGRSLLSEDCWQNSYELVFALELNTAECEHLTGELKRAEERLLVLSKRAINVVNRAAVVSLRVILSLTLAHPERSVEICLEYLRGVGIDWSTQPSNEDVKQELDGMWQRIGSRTIESLFDLPLMSDPAWCATMDVFTNALSPALFTSENLAGLILLRMANLSISHGNSDASCFAYTYLNIVLGSRFGDYGAGFRFGQLSLNLVEQRGLNRYKPRVYLCFGNQIIPWTSHLRTGRTLIRRAFETAIESGDVNYAAYSCINMVTNLLAAGDALDDVQRECERGLEFARKVHFPLAVHIMTSQFMLVRTLMGLTPEFGSITDGGFVEGEFEKDLETNPAFALPTCWYWIRRLQACFYAARYAAAIEAAEKAGRLLWTTASFLEEAEYHLYAALARSAVYDSAPGDHKVRDLDTLLTHHKRLSLWATNCPDNFGSPAALVAAEIARIEGRELDAERSYEAAIQLGREYGFVQNEGLAHEAAARFYAARGFKTISEAYLRNARSCYERWGAVGKVNQLDQLYPRLREGHNHIPSATMIAAPVERLDLGAVIKSSQALSSEIVLGQLIEKLMATTVKIAGAERGLLIVPRGDDFFVEAEATIALGTVAVRLRQIAVAPSELPGSILQFVIRTKEHVILEDASVPNLFSEDEYIRRRHCRSILCVPLVNQTRLIAVLYLENQLVPHVFTEARVAVLKMLASQAAISLENAALYTDLRQTGRYLTDAQRLSHTGSFGWDVASGQLFWSEETFRIFEEDSTNCVPTLELVLQRTHPEDVARIQQEVERATRDKKDFDFEHRLLMRDGSIKYVHVVAHAVKDQLDNLTFVGALADITARRLAEDSLRSSEQNLRLIVNSIPGYVCALTASGEIEFVNNQVLEYFGKTLDELKNWAVSDSVYPDDLPDVIATMKTSMETGEPTEVELRLRRADRIYRWFLLRRLPQRDSRGHLVRWYTLHTDIEDRKRAETSLRSSEQNFRLIINSIPGYVYAETASGEIEYANQQVLAYFGKTIDELKNWAASEIVYPDDVEGLVAKVRTSNETGEPTEVELRLRRADGIYRWFLLRRLPQRDSDGQIVRSYSLLTDIEDRKQAEEEIRRSETELRQILDFAPQNVIVLAPDRDHTRLYANQTSLDYLGFTLEEWRTTDLHEYIYPGDWERVTRETHDRFLSGLPYECEARFRGKDGTYRWFLMRLNPVRDEQGRVTRWYSANTDIDDRKQAEQRLQNENIALREEVDQASMFEEIVGSSPSLRRVLSQVAKVAPTDSTVLILGETGTGKELIARAIHNRSNRSTRAFVRVNCAAIPQSLIASELFGHEKGAFTGATQRRLGRFELAHEGTIFLDEVGELPAETQITLLRVLQEREVERVGGSQPISVDVRVLAATNRNLNAAVDSGTVRQDLFYRLNVFPIEIPPLRERSDDIPVLVEYLVERYAKKAGKRIVKISKKTLELFQTYAWPGNIRELQNVIERAVVLSDGDSFSVDESWLKRKQPPESPSSSMTTEALRRLDTDREREIIEAALAETGGRIAGPFGAAAKLGIPRQTLDSKISILGINKHRFKSA
jgi:PAS domain S-box-containing protein